MTLPEKTCHSEGATGATRSGTIKVKFHLNFGNFHVSNGEGADESYK